MDGHDAVTGYYDAIDAGAYDRLEAVLTPDFVHLRPDRLLGDRETFVQFMRDERPRTDTRHELDGVCVSTEEGETTVFVQGTLLADDGDVLFGFTDVFDVVEGRIESVTTYTR